MAPNFVQHMDRVTGEAILALGAGQSFKSILIDVAQESISWERQNNQMKERFKYTLIYSEYVGGGSHPVYTQRHKYVITDDLQQMIKYLDIGGGLWTIFEGHPKLEGCDMTPEIEEQFFNVRGI